MRKIKLLSIERKVMVYIMVGAWIPILLCLSLVYWNLKSNILITQTIVDETIVISEKNPSSISILPSAQANYQPITPELNGANINFQLQTPNTFAQWLSQTESPIFYLNYLFALMAGFITLSLFFIGHRLAQNIRLNTQEIKNTLKKMNTSTHSNHHCRYYHDNNCKRINITEFDALESDIESLHEAQSKRYFDLKIRSDTENLILSSLDKDHIIYTVLADIEHIIECDNAFFVLFNKRETNNHNIFTLHAHTDKLEQQPIELDSKSIFYSNKEPKPIFYAGLNNNLPDALMAYVEPYSHKGILPIRFDDKLFGMLILTWHHDDAWNDSELQNAEDFCLKIGMALSNSALEDSLYKKNHFDKLTNLPNRLLFQDRLKQALLRSERSNNCTALMIIDIDNFSSVNESLGTHAGDSYLKDIAQRLVSCMRQVDTVARLGGDEFAVILPDIANDEKVYLHLGTIAQMLLNVVSWPFRYQDVNIQLTGSIGISIYPQDNKQVNNLIKYADYSHHQAKSEGKNNYVFYHKEISAQSKTQLLLENDLRQALGRDEFILFYQPEIDVETNQISGIEALVRWRHPERGLIHPGLFIPLAEELGMMKSLGEWIIHNTCKDIKSIIELDLPYVIPGAVNLSISQLDPDLLINSIKHSLKEYKIPAEYFCIEITENTMVKEYSKVSGLFEELSSLGIKTTLDDFGTGYSCLQQLHELPLDNVKINRNFIRHVSPDSPKASLVESILSLAKNLDVKVTATGVETQQELDFLQSHDCNNIQGYYFSRPLNKKTLMGFIQSWD